MRKGVVDVGPRTVVVPYFVEPNGLLDARSRMAAQRALSLVFLVPQGERYFRQRLNECADDAGASCWAQCRAFGGVYASGGIFLGSRRAVLSLAEEVVRSAEACGYWESDQGLVNYAVPRGGGGGTRPDA
ncbi:hypothetical protein JL720_17290 [Aureococcus anophagefferens]|nr:hypothetical protein JL720_17290 [Aureococcus anophagefferens]